MKFLIDNKKTLLFFIVFTLITNLTFAQNQEIIPSQGFGTQSFLRGVLGIIFLIFTTYLLSNNKKAINWKTAGFGLILQLILAIGVLKVSWIKTVFENAGKIFVKILDFTMEGTKFLFGDLVNSFIG